MTQSTKAGSLDCEIKLNDLKVKRVRNQKVSTTSFYFLSNGVIEIYSLHFRL